MCVSRRAPVRTFFATLSLSLGLLATAAQADGIYKWVDEDGVVHFGSQPPQKEQIEVVKAPRSERLKRWQQEQNTLAAKRQPQQEAKAEPAATPAPDRDQAERKQTADAELAARAQRCQSAQRRLTELRNHARVREVDASGNYRVLGEDERQQRIQQTQQLLQNNC